MSLLQLLSQLLKGFLISFTAASHIMLVPVRVLCLIFFRNLRQSLKKEILRSFGDYHNIRYCFLADFASRLAKFKRVFQLLLLLLRRRLGCTIVGFLRHWVVPLVEEPLHVLD